MCCDLGLVLRSVIVCARVFDTCSFEVRFCRARVVFCQLWALGSIPMRAVFSCVLSILPFMCESCFVCRTQVGSDETQAWELATKATTANDAPGAGSDCEADPHQAKTTKQRREELKADIAHMRSLNLFDGHGDGVAAPSCAEGDPEKVTHSRKVLQTVNSMVSVCNIYMGNVAAAHDESSWTCETAVVPPMRVEDKTHKTIARALWRQLEEYVFGMTVHDMATLYFGSALLVLWVFVLDGATNNSAMSDKCDGYLCSDEFQALATTTYYKHWCFLHRFGRVGVTLLTRLNVSKNLYALTRAFRISGPRKSWRKGLFAAMDANFIFAVVLIPYAQRDAILAALLAVLLLVWGADDSTKSAEAAAWHQHQFRKLWCFLGFGGNVLGVNDVDAFGHTCSAEACGPRLCASERQSKRRLKNHTYNLFFACGLEAYQTGRWRKLVPALRYWCWLLVFFGPSLILESMRYVSVNDIKKDINEKLGKRLGKAITWLGDGSTVFHMLLVLVLFQLLGECVNLIFSFHSRSNTPNVYGVSTGTEDDRKAAKSEKPISQTLRVMRAVRHLSEKLWVSLNEGDVGDADGISPWTVLEHFWPDARPESERVSLVTWAVLLVLSELYLRFEVEFSHPPYLFASLEVGPTSLWETVGLVAFLQYNACCLMAMCAVWLRKIKSVNDATKPKLLRLFFAQWRVGVRHSTLAEEDWHGFQKRMLPDMSEAYETQVDEMTIEGVKRAWNEKGLRDLSVAPKPLQVRFKTAVKKRIKHKRTGSKGNHVFSWVWKSMGKAEKKRIGSDNKKRSEALKAGRARFETLPEEQKRRTCSS